MEKNRLLYADYLEVLYLDRNKNYGSYELRRNYPQRLKKGLGIVLLFLIFLFIFQKIILTISTPALAASHKPTQFTDVVLPKTIRCPLVEPAKPPKPKQHQPFKTSSATPSLAVVKIIHSTDSLPILNQAHLQETMETAHNGNENNPTGTNLNNSTGVINGTGESNENNTIKKIVHLNELSVLPKFPGGESRLNQFLVSTIVYAEEFKNAGQEGTAEIAFVIDEEGNVNQIEVSKSSGFSSLDQEALRVIGLMPKWKPGEQNGQPVSVYFKIPIGFKLEE